MLTPRFSLTASRDSSVPLRFDDVEFLEALERDSADEHDEVKTPLARMLGCKRAADYDLSPFIEVGLTIHARPAVLAKGTKDAYTDARRGDGGADVAVFDARMWTLWVTRVTVNEEVQFEDAPNQRVWGMLSRPDKRSQGEGFDLLEERIQKVLSVRLRVHREARDRAADRDPGKAATQTDGW